MVDPKRRRSPIPTTLVRAKRAAENGNEREQYLDEGHARPSAL